MKNLKLFSLLILFFLPLISFAQTNPGDTLWAKSTFGGSNVSNFQEVAIDSNGNYYAAGKIVGNDNFDFGDGITVAGPYSDDNIVLVKYDTNGKTIWAKSFLSGTNYSTIKSVTTDNNNNIYVVGYIKGNSIFYLGNAIIIAGSAATKHNIFVAKYDSNGNALWDRSTISGPDVDASLNDVVVDSSGDVYVVGSMDSGTYDLGNGINTTISTGATNNIILIKYNKKRCQVLTIDIKGPKNGSVKDSV